MELISRDVILCFFLTFSQRQTGQSSALAALMSFSVKLSDMERQIASYERTIKRQTAEIDQLTAKLDSKADRSQFRNLQVLLNSKMTTVKDEINTKDLVIERYRNKLRQIEGEISVSGCKKVLPLSCLVFGLLIVRSPSPGASNSHVFVQRRFHKLGYFCIYKSFPAKLVLIDATSSLPYVLKENVLRFSLTITVPVNR